MIALGIQDLQHIHCQIFTQRYKFLGRMSHRYRGRATASATGFADAPCLRHWLRHPTRRLRCALLLHYLAAQIGERKTEHVKVF